MNPSFIRCGNWSPEREVTDLSKVFYLPSLMGGSEVWAQSCAQGNSICRPLCSKIPLLSKWGNSQPPGNCSSNVLGGFWYPLSSPRPPTAPFLGPLDWPAPTHNHKGSGEDTKEVLNLLVSKNKAILRTKWTFSKAGVLLEESSPSPQGLGTGEGHTGHERG